MAREFTDKQKKAWKEQMKEREDQAKEQIHDLARSFRDTPEQIQEFLTMGCIISRIFIRYLLKRKKKGKKHRSMNILRKSSAGETRFIMTRQS